MFVFASRRRNTREACDWSSDVCSSDLREEWEEIVDEGHDVGEESEEEDDYEDFADAGSIPRIIGEDNRGNENRRQIGAENSGSGEGGGGGGNRSPDRKSVV